MSTLVSCSGVTKKYILREGIFSKPREIRALDNAGITIDENETLGLVGESGSGKSTLGRAILRLIPLDAGTITFMGTDITDTGNDALRPLRKNMQAIFQDPFSSLNPKFRIGSILREPLEIHTAMTKSDMDDAVAMMLRRVGMDPADMRKYPHEFSGGQRQRINIARALMLRPRFIVADEPVSSLDVSIQAQILNLFMELKAEYGFSTLFISHDLRVVRHISDRIAVISKGSIVETGQPAAIFENPRHPYTKMLISALPEIISKRNSAQARGTD